MKRAFVMFLLVFICLSQLMLNGQSAGGNLPKANLYAIEEAYYIESDSSFLLNDWTEQGMNIIFASENDSLVITIDIGGRDNICFMGMAVAMANPGFIASNSTAEFYHWIFISRIKEGLHDAYIHKEYIDKSFEELGHRLYFINILFPDQTEFQFYAGELTLDSLNSR